MSGTRKLVPQKICSLFSGTNFSTRFFSGTNKTWFFLVLKVFWYKIEYGLFDFASVCGYLAYRLARHDAPVLPCDGGAHSSRENVDARMETAAPWLRDRADDGRLRSIGTKPGVDKIHGEDTGYIAVARLCNARALHRARAHAHP